MCLIQGPGLELATSLSISCMNLAHATKQFFIQFTFYVNFCHIIPPLWNSFRCVGLLFYRGIIIVDIDLLSTFVMLKIIPLFEKCRWIFEKDFRHGTIWYNSPKTTYISVNLQAQLLVADKSLDLTRMLGIVLTTPGPRNHRLHSSQTKLKHPWS